MGQLEWREAVDAGHVANRAHLADVRLVEVTDGPATGSRLVEMWAADSFRLEVMLNRAGDIGRMEYRGLPISWTSPVGYTRQSSGPDDELSFLRSFPGGLLATCGLEHAFAAETEERSSARNPHGATRLFPLHGSLSHHAARLSGYGVECSEGGEPVLWCETSTRQVMMFEEDLQLDRRIEVLPSRRTIRLHDTITNLGRGSSVLMVDYHTNFGYPLLNQGARIVYGNGDPWDTSVDANDGYVSPSPAPGVAERVRSWTRTEGADGWSTVSLIAADDTWAVQQRSRGTLLRYDVLWEWYAAGAYVVGLEAASNSPDGRATARRRGELSELSPGEQHKVDLEWTVLARLDPQVDGV